MAQQKHIIVLGAGVIGLQIANTLLDAGHRVTILAKHLPQDRSIEYTSPWAGAHWRSHASHDDKEQQKWDRETYDYWLSLLGRELNEPEGTVKKSGLGIYDSVFYSPKVDEPWFKKDVLRYRELSGKQLPEGMQSGHRYSSIMINTPMYLEFLLENALEQGATVIKAAVPVSSNIKFALRAATDIINHHLQSKDSTPPKIDAFVNATGIGARYMVPDDKIYPMAGQTVSVRGEANQITTVDGDPTSTTADAPQISYVLPRPYSKVTILGGTKGTGDWIGEVDPKVTETILREGKKWAPELLNENGEFEILSVQVGLRPGRKGGARIEIEQFDDQMVVCHAYGMAGAGYQNSVGVARKVLGLFSEHFGVTAQSATETPKVAKL